MQIRLLETSDIKRMIAARGSTRVYSDHEILLATIMEVIDAAEQARKGRGLYSLDQFRHWWRIKQLPKGASQGQQIQIIGLDQDRLHDALFERDAGYVVTGYWQPAAAHEGVGPERTARRLILRPTEQTWWGEGIYLQMEAWFEQ